MSESAQLLQSARPLPPHAFTRGTGLIYQCVGVFLLLLAAVVIASGGLSSALAAARPDQQRSGWGTGSDGEAIYSVRQGLSATLAFTAFYGAALLVIGARLRATHRRTPLIACVVTALAIVVYLAHGALFTTAIHWIFIAIGSGFLGVISSVLLLLAVMARKDSTESSRPLPEERPARPGATTLKPREE